MNNDNTNWNAKRLVITPASWFGSSARGVADAFRCFGWEVTEIEYDKFFSVHKNLTLRLAQRILTPLAVKEYNNHIIYMCKLIKPNAFIALKGVGISSKTLKLLNKSGIKTANYYPDVHFQHRRLIEETFPYYSRFFTTKSFQVSYLQGKLGSNRVEYLPHGYSCVYRPVVDGIVPERDMEADVGYIGNYNANKERWLSSIRRMFPELRLRIFGGGWRESFRDGKLAECIQSGPVMGTTYASVVQRTKINLAVHSGPSGPHGWEDLVSTRTFEIPACRGFMLHIDNVEVRSMFDVGKEIGVFQSEEELGREIEHYLDDEVLRSGMIEAAYKRCVPQYTYHERVRRIDEYFRGEE